MNISFKNLFWLFPFAGFFAGYVICFLLLQKSEIIVPTALGKNIHEAAGIFSSCDLGLRVLAEREDAVLPDGVILDQIPKPGRKCRPNQHVFVVVSKKLSSKIMPDFSNKALPEINDWANKNKIEIRAITNTSTHPKQFCFAQSPNPGSKIAGKRITVYISSGQKEFKIMPKLIGHSLTEAQEALKKVKAEIDIIYTEQTALFFSSNSGIVLDQKPMAGSIINLDKPLYVQLQVAK
jgi:beta-lactam-binding protein with PASTA domain